MQLLTIIRCATWLMLLVGSCVFKVQSRHDPQLAVTKDPPLYNTHMILILDYSKMERQWVQSLQQFTRDLFHGFSDVSVELFIQSLKMDNVHFTVYSAINSKHKEKMFTEELYRYYKDGKDHPVNNRTLCWYAGALRKSAQLLDAGSSDLKVVVMITHGKEQCPSNSCADCCHRCGSCDSCTRRIDGVDVDLVVTDQVEELKARSIEVITIGVGGNVDAQRLKCWASSGNFTPVSDYRHLPLMGYSVAVQVLDILRSTKSTATLTSATTLPSAATHASATSLIAVSNKVPKQPLLSSMLLAPTKTVEMKADNSNGHMKWYWWLFAGISIMVVVLTVAMLLISVVVCRWKSKKQGLIPLIFGKGRGGPTKYPSTSFSGFSSKQSASFASISSSPDSFTIKDPNLVTDPGDGEINRGLIRQNKPLGLSRLPGVISLVATKSPVPSEHKTAIPRLPTAKGKKAPEMKAISVTRVNENNSPLYKGTVTCKTPGKYETVNPGTFRGAKTFQYVPIRKTIMTPPQPRSGKSDEFKSLE